MSAEGMPQNEPSYLARPLELVTRLVVRFPWFFVGTAVVLAVVCTAATARFMQFHASRLDLLNPASHYNKRWLAYLEEFGNEDDVVVIVEGGHRDSVVPVIDAIAKAIAREPSYFENVLYKRELDTIKAKALHFLTEEKLKEIDQFLQQVDPISRGSWSMLDVHKQIPSVNARLSSRKLFGEQAGSAAENRGAVAHAQLIAQRLSAAISDVPAQISLWPDADRMVEGLRRFDSEYLLNHDGSMGFVLLRIARSKDQFVQGSGAIQRLRELLHTAGNQHPDVRVGLTGMPVLENDEMQSSQADMVRASILSLIGVACLFVAGFGGVRHPMMTVTALILAIAWSFGYVTLAVGHLNILSVSFGVILIGLGIDFGIHYVARYLQLRRTIHESETALVQTASSVGPGIITGGITTALAFSTAALTDFTGIAELGIIAGGGILLCIVAALVVLPAMIQLADKGVREEEIPAPIPIDTVLQSILRLPQFVLMVSLCFTAMLACGAFWLRYDHNLLNMQPTQIESVQWERRLIAKSDRSVWFGLSIADSPEGLRQLKEQFEKLETVDRTEEIVSLLPESTPTKTSLIRSASKRLQQLPEQPPVIPIAAPDQLSHSLSDLAGHLSKRSEDQPVAALVADLQKRLKQLTPREYYERISAYQQVTCIELLRRLQSLARIADPTPPQLWDLPEGLRKRFVGKSNRHLLKVYARSNIWDMDQLEQFVAELESVDPKVTGHPVQTFYASRQMQQSYFHAAIYSLLLVAIVLVLDFRNLQLALLALLPMGLGTLQLFGILGLLDIPLNPANMIVLPLILGIGIDDGVHVVHDFRRQTGKYRLSSSTATAVLITSATTMIGFGTMMFASHQGLRSLGQVLTIGVFCCLGTSILILPALLALMTRNRPTDDDRDATAEDLADSDADLSSAEMYEEEALEEAITAQFDEQPAGNTTVVRRRSRRRMAA